jgi:hypothetical protein
LALFCGGRERGWTGSGSSEKGRRRDSLDGLLWGTRGGCLFISEVLLHRLIRKRLPLGPYSRPGSGRDRMDRIGVEREGSEKGFAGRKKVSKTYA